MLSVLEKNESPPTALFPFVLDAHVAGNVPDGSLKVAPACNQICRYKLAFTSSPNAPVVSAGKDNSTLAQSVVTLNVFATCLVLSPSNSSHT